MTIPAVGIAMHEQNSRKRFNLRTGRDYEGRREEPMEVDASHLNGVSFVGSVSMRKFVHKFSPSLRRKLAGLIYKGHYPLLVLPSRGSCQGTLREI